MFTKENIIEEINNDLRKAYNGDLSNCRLNLFQYFQFKYDYNRNRPYVGYILNPERDSNGKIQYALDIPSIGTLNNANILSEIKDFEIDNYFFELICTHRRALGLKNLLISILDSKNIGYKKDLYSMFIALKEHDKEIFKTRKYFPFRFFKLSDKYAPYEETLWEVLKEEFGWRLQYKFRKDV